MTIAAARISRGHICSFSDQRDYQIALNGEIFRFEFSDQFGPVVLGKRGELLEAQPRPSHMFWKATSEWLLQGKRVCPCGMCIWRPDRVFNASDFVLVHKGGRNYLVTTAHIFQNDRCCGMVKRHQCEQTVYSPEQLRRTGRGRSGFERHYTKHQCSRNALPGERYCKIHGRWKPDELRKREASQ